MRLSCERSVDAVSNISSGFTWLFRLAAYAIVLIATLSAVGCGNAEVDYEVDGSGNDEDGRGLSQFSDAVSNGWDEPVWEAKATTPDGKEVSCPIFVRAMVKVPEAKEMSVVEVNKFEFSRGNRQMVAEGIFGNTVDSFATKQLPRSMLEKRLERVRSNLEYYQAAEADAAVGDGRRQIISEKERWEKKVEEYTQYVGNASDDFEMAATCDYGANYFMGKLNGEDFLLQFYVPETEDVNMEVDEWQVEAARIILLPKDKTKFYPDELKDAREVSCHGDIHTKPNVCTMTKEEAKKRADDFVAGAGFSDWICKNEIKDLQWEAEYGGTRGNKVVADGYALTYEPGVDGVPFGIDDKYYYYLLGYFSDADRVIGWGDDSLMPHESMQPQLMIYITDDGIIGAQWYDPITTTAITRGVSLLSFDSIKNTVKDGLTEYAEQIALTLTGVPCKVDHVELVYFRMKDGKNKGYYTYVPAWMVAQERNNIFMVNAIDGSMIDVAAQSDALQVE